MKTIKINTFEDFQHLCLMFGLKKAYMRFPFLVNNILATPPPFHRNPNRPHVFIGSKLNTVCVQYHKKDAVILYDESKTTESVIVEFAKTIMEEYLDLRHPYMQTEWTERILVEKSTKTPIAKIL